MRCEFGEGGHEKLLRNWHQDLNRRLEQHWGSFRKPERRPGAGPSAGVFALQLMQGGSPWNFSCVSALGTVLAKRRYGGILAE